MSDIKFEAKVDAKKGEASLQRLDKGVTKVEKSTKKTGAGFKQLAIGLAAGVAAFAIASKALRGLVRWMGDAVDKSAIQQTAEAEMRAALESTGREVEANAEHFKLYASEIQSATIFGDEQILSAQALMIQLTKLDQKGLDAATKGAIGLASVYKTDLQAATTLVGKALAGNYGALSRYGISVERTATAEVKRAQLLSQLLVMYKRAEAEVDTYAGAMAQLSNIYGDLKEQVGKVVTGNEDFRDTIKQITELTGDLIESGLVEWVTDIAVQAIKSAPMMDALVKSLTMVLMIYKIQAEKQKKADEAQVEWIKHLQLNDDLQIKLRGDIAAVIEVTEEQEEAVFDAAAAWTELHNRVAAMELEAEITKWKEWVDVMLGVKEEADHLAYAWDQDMVGMEEKTLAFMATIIPGMAFLASSYEGEAERILTANEALMESWGLTSESQLAFSEAMISEFVNMEASVKGFVTAIMNTFEQWAIGQIIPTIMAALPFPANLLATGGAILAIKALFAGIRGAMETPEGKAEGGWVGLHGKEIVKVGERGPEYITKNSDIRNIYDQRARTISITIIVKDQLDPYSAQRITRTQIVPAILESLDVNENKRAWQEKLE